jgi:predicted RNase H-like HicB family nuclease
MVEPIFVNAEWDDEAGVWVAQSSNLKGLVTEAESIELLREKLPGMVLDLLEADGPRVRGDVPIEIHAHVNAYLRAG